MQDSNHTIRYSILRLNAHVKEKEVALMRGAILSLVKDKGGVSFHNHVSNDEYVYSYPLIQYKSLNGYGCVVFIGEAVALIGQLLSAQQCQLLIGKRNEPVFPVSLLGDDCRVGYSEVPVQYTMKNWIPLNAENFSQYLGLASLSEKVEMLNRVLIGNILSCLKGLGIHAEFDIMVQIQDLDKHDLFIKGTKFISFDVIFTSNVDLPEFIGLGKSSSKGYGVIMKKTYIQ